ncbi:MULTISPECIES: chemotaxis protein CheW [unclassified Lentimicrobium]|uniref:chemotaxis protein CheW n=1 Tax=unclassified Lentimicrobium TaxID=2677434 RepID=UPI00155517F8|nr:MULTISPECIES: chemotaxis protein CheW [unclassified Lentimicrobium]NPD45677.1 chemotaxis protein CheW [Lentimicrobium sp. S6]NPD85556.1 chemotaxis protein CheW [Lentimicrobium sp. L6]
MKKLSSYLTFQLGKEKFAANIANVLHILGVPQITELPNSPAHIKGAINLRGKVLTVIDPHMKFEIESQEITKNSCIVVLEMEYESDRLEIGALVDSVDKVIEITENELLPPPDLGTKFKSEYIENVININDEFIMVLNIKNVFTSEY